MNNIIVLINNHPMSRDLETLIRLACLSITLLSGLFILEKAYKLVRRFFHE